MSSKQEQAWEAWTSTLPSVARDKLNAKPRDPLLPKPQRKDDEEEAYEHFCSSLPSQAADKLKATTAEDAVEPDVGKARYCEIECADGEMPVLRAFKSPEALVRHLGKLEGKDTGVRCVYGIPMELTKGPQRYLKLPDGTAITVPLYDGGPIKRVNADLIDGLEIEEDGFLGKPEMLYGDGIEQELEEAAQLGQPPSDDEDDED